MDKLLEFINKHKLLTTLAAVGVLGLIFTVSAFGYVNSQRNKGIDYETSLSARYNSCQNNLSKYVSGFYEQASVSREKANKLNAILRDAVSGRYDQQGSSASQAVVNGNALFSAVVEAYPDLNQLSIYDELVKYVQAGRTEFQGCQDALLDRVRVYDKWRKQGLIGHVVKESVLGFPSDTLEASIGDDTVTGKPALVRIKRIVLSPDAKQAYETGEQGPLELPTETPPAATPPATPPALSTSAE